MVVSHPISPVPYPDIPSVDDLDYSNLLIYRRLDELPLPTEKLSVLNLGAGNGEGEFAQQIQCLPLRLLTNVELHPDALFKLSHNFHFSDSVDYINADMLEYVRVLPDKSYDACLMIDSLEHLTRVQAVELIGHLRRVVRHRVLIWLPFGNTPQGEYGGNPHQAHKSTWTPEDFLSMGASVDVCWRHWHVTGAPYAGWVTFNFTDSLEATA